MTAPIAQHVFYAGPADDADYLGYAQANFALRWPDHSIREVAIFVNSPALTEVAQAVGRDLDDDTRDTIARIAGEVILQQFTDPEGYIDPNITVSRATLARHPEIIEAARAAFNTPAP